MSLAGIASGLITVSSAIVEPGTASAATTAEAAADTDRTSAIDPWSAASTEARRSGGSVEVNSATTATSKITANPSGGFTLTQNAQPVRALVGGSWRPLDATLVAQADGTIGPRLSARPLSLSGGGNGPLARLTAQGHTMDLGAPLTLPTPELDGAKATYADVLPGVDLEVTADTQGSMRTVFVVHSQEAADNALLRELTFSVKGEDLALSQDAAGNLSADHKTMGSLFRASGALMWDSTRGPDADATAGQRKTGTSGTNQRAAIPETDSSAAGPGSASRTAPITLKAASGTMRLLPDRTMLDSPNTAWPVFIDPAWSSVSGKKSGWATITPDYPSTNYWNSSPDPYGKMQVGNVGEIRSRTLINFPISSVLSGATIGSATLNLFESWSYSCTTSVMNVYAPMSKTLSSSNATWNSWSGVDLGSVVGTAKKAYGYNSSCPAAAFGIDVKDGITAALAAKHTTQTLLLAAGDSSYNGWKEFEPNTSTTPALTIEFNHPVNAPSNLRTSPETTCTATTPTVVGDGAVTLYGTVSDPDRESMTVRFTVKNATTGAVIANPTLTGTYGTGALVSYTVPQATLRTAAAGSQATLAWYITASDISTTKSSATCKFVFDASRPGAPVLTPSGATPQVGEPLEITIAPPSGGTVPASYQYQLNAQPSTTVTPDTSGTATVFVTPGRQYNVLTVSSLSAGGNYSETQAALPFTADLAEPVSPHDFTGDGAADLLAMGGSNGLPDGLWLAGGDNAGAVSTLTANIGAYGNGTDSTRSAADFTTGWQVLTGAFTHKYAQDVLAYKNAPTPGDQGIGQGVLIQGTTDGTPLRTQSAASTTPMDPGFFADLNGSDPSQLVAVGAHKDWTQSSLEDLLGTTDSLVYYPAGVSPGGFGLAQLVTDGGGAALTPPVAGTSWTDWVLTGTQVQNPTDRSTSLFLWYPPTGALYLWGDITVGLSPDVEAVSLGFTQRTLAATGWNTGLSSALHAADMNGDGRADVWTVGPNGAVTAYLQTSAGALAAQSPRTLTTTTHSWGLGDHEPATSDTVYQVDSTKAAKDASSNPLPLIGTGTGATWTSGSGISPAVLLNGAALTTQGATPAAVATGGPFSLTAWARPDVSGGVLVSQNGANTAAFKIWPEASDASWRVAISSADVASPTWTTISAQPKSVWPGQWTKVSVTYRADGWLHLYLNDVKVAGVLKPGLWSATGALRIGDARVSSTSYSTKYKGQVAQVQTWNTAIEPSSAQSPAGYYQTISPTRVLDTRTGTGGATGLRSTNSTTRVKVRGVGNIPDRSDITAVALTLTAVTPTSTGYLLPYPANTPRPHASLTQYVPGEGGSAGFAITEIGTNGYIDIFNSGGGLHVVAEVNGYFTSNPSATGNLTFFPLQVRALVNTRNGTGAPQAALAAGATLPVQVGGTTDVPAGAKAALVQLTVTEAASQGWLSVWSNTTTKSSMLQYLPTLSRVITQIVPLGTDGRFLLSPSSGPSHASVSLVGYFTTETTGKKFHTLPVSRLADTRYGSQLAPGQVFTVGQGAAVVADRACLLVNATAVQPQASGLLRLSSGDGTYDSSGILITLSGRNPTNADVVPAGNTRSIRAVSGATTHLIIDRFGYFSN